MKATSHGKPGAATGPSRLPVTCCTVLAVLAGSGPAYAYLDPGTGSIILQSILASIAVAFGVVRMHWERCKLLFSRLTRFANRVENGRSTDSDNQSGR